MSYENTIAQHCDCCSPCLITWCVSVAIEEAEERELLKSHRASGSVYLIDEADSEESFTDAIANYASTILTNEIIGVLTRVSGRALMPTSEQWFTSTELMAFDLANEPLLIADTDQLGDDGEIISSDQWLIVIACAMT